ncbi:IPExxxVDY family protein [Flavisolibacter ginsenosidimutans]|uniref:IPExxxVDY family protein n=1 Tax=Flavisolibacter ginsenosidimutans TaxID=661481 RepID=A0A5B8ULC0_9BACT|nr:IPExxxVDY family protein [Flavisolibacter ginsenosidimutans]QEC57501.1 IPExxxVDY family protein [Flavisolibacter ginsenosidimutans]
MAFVLDNKEMVEGFFEETRLLGIQAPVKDYMFCWQVNQLMNIDFRINNELEIQLKKKGRNYFFAVYEYAQPSCCLMHYLYNNQHDGEYLLPEFKHLDFLWLLKDDCVSNEFVDDLVYSLRSINGVQLVMELTNEKIKNKEHLVF